MPPEHGHDDARRRRVADIARRVREGRYAVDVDRLAERLVPELEPAPKFPPDRDERLDDDGEPRDEEV